MTALERRNLTLGLLIGGLCLAQLAVFIILFTHYGLPKDPKIWAEMQAREAQQAEARALQPPPAPVQPTPSVQPADQPASRAESRP